MAVAVAPGAGSAADLKVTIAGVQSSAGALMIGLYDNATGYAQAIANTGQAGLLKDEGRLVGVTMRAKNGAESVGFMDLPPGRYAVIVFHDQNDNGLMDEDATGIPQEGYGFSNNASSFLGAPSFDAAAFDLGAAATAITISLGYPTTAPQARLTK
jgi:uncharacterized protein (DUF2141 family)